MTKFRGFQKYAYKRQKPGYYLHDFLNTKNPLELFRSKKFVLGIVALAVIVGGIALAQSPLFHNVIPNPNAVEDPITWLWRATAPTGANLNEFNHIQAQSFQVGSNRTVFLQPNSTTTAIALTKVSTDFSVLSGKQLYGLFSWNINTNCCVNEHWGVYLTTNGTLPTQHNYNPYNDSAVSLLLLNQNTGGNTFTENLFLKRGETQSIANGDTGGCSPSSTCFLSLGFSNTTTTMQQPKSVIQEFILNFTGSTNLGTSCNAAGAGNNCSSMGIDNFRHGTQSVNVTSQLVPWFNFQTKSYFVGFYFLFGNSNGPVSFQFDTGNFASSCSNSQGTTGQACMELNLAIQSPTAAVAPANIDTGGFFGPIIRALISIGVFILANIIAFGNYLAGLMGPVWAFLGSLATTVLNGLSSVIISLLNGLGSLIGDPNLGDQLVSVFTQIGSYITSLFAKINSLVSTLVTFLVDSFNFLFDVTNGFLTYWIGTVLFGILGVLVTISNIIVTVLKVFQVGFPFVVLADLLWLLSESVDHGTEGAMKWWAPHEILIVNVAKLMFVLVETLSTFIFQTITEIEGGVADIKPEIAGFSP